MQMFNNLLGLSCGWSVGFILWVISWVYPVGDLLGLSCGWSVGFILWVICWIYPVGDLLGLSCGWSAGFILWMICWVYPVGYLLGLSCHAWRAPWVRPMVGPGPRTAPNLLLRAHATMKNNWRQANCSSSGFTAKDWDLIISCERWVRKN